MELTQALANNYVFRGVPLPVVRVVAAYAAEHTLPGGTVIVRQFDRSDTLYVVLDGEAATFDARGRVVARFGPGSLVGEMALLDGEPRSATVTAQGPVRVAAIRAEVVLGMIDADPALGRMVMGNLARVLCRRLRTMNTHVDREALGVA